MPLPTSYTEDTFKAYLHTRFAAYSGIFSWTVVGGSYDEILNDTLLVMSETDITTITDIKSLRAVGEWQLWLAALDSAGALYDFKVDAGDFKRSQMFKAIQAKVTLASQHPSVAEYDTGYEVTVTTINHTNDPYAADRSDWYFNRVADDET